MQSVSADFDIWDLKEIHIVTDAVITVRRVDEYGILGALKGNIVFALGKHLRYVIPVEVFYTYDVVVREVVDHVEQALRLVNSVRVEIKIVKDRPSVVPEVITFLAFFDSVVYHICVVCMIYDFLRLSVIEETVYTGIICKEWSLNKYVVVNYIVASAVEHESSDLVEDISVYLLTGRTVVKIYAILCAARHIHKQVITYLVVTIRLGVPCIYRAEVVSCHHHVIEYVVLYLGIYTVIEAYC